MFDDLKQGQNPVQGGGQSTSGNNQMPPKGPVDDMFAATDPTPDKPSAIQSGLVKPISQTQVPTQAAAPVEEPLQQEPAQPANMAMAGVGVSRGTGGAKKGLIILVALILVAALAYGAYYFFFSGLDSNSAMKNDNSSVTNENTNEEPVLTDEELDDDDDGLTNAEEKRIGTDPLETDTDNDGLFDREEVKNFKTDPTTADTDNDGLSDYNEVKVWFTDPLLRDTDGDTYADGEEVLNGYDPLGAGRLDDNQGDISYKSYLDPIFNYSISIPETWVDIYETKEEPVFYTLVKFLPNVGSVEYINVKVTKIDYGSQDEFRNILPAEFDWVEYTLAGKPAYRSINETRVMLYLAPDAEAGTEGLVYSLSYEGSEYSNGVYMGIFQYMLDNFAFSEN